MKVSLEVIKGPEMGRRFEFTEPGGFLVGRARDAHFRLSDEDPYVGRRHFLLEISPPRVYLKDLDSKNKPCVNGLIRVEEELHDGDVIEVGYTQLRIAVSDESVPQSVNCLKCGKPFHHAGRRVPDFCAGCAAAMEAPEPARPAAAIGRVACACGEDLTGRADSDGRAAELHGVVRYCCPACARSLQHGEEAGRRIDAYEVLSFLGKGGMGQVYQVYHEPTARVLALKQMLNLNLNELNQRFRREIRYMREITHPNTIRFVDSGVAAGGPFLVTEMASHGSLGDLLNPETPFLRPHVAVGYLLGALHGLEAIHQAKIVHRDLKPENILLQETEDGTLVPKISDFGLAKRYTEAGGSLMTKLGARLGTVLYMPPEQIRDSSSVREPADIYAMGVTLYYLLSGKYPFDFPTPLDLLRRLREQPGMTENQEEFLRFLMRERQIKNPHAIVLNEKPIPIRDRKRDLPPKLSAVVDKAIRKEISARHQSAAEFRRALEEASA